MRELLHGDLGTMEILIRVSIACVLGMILGIDRELRGISAGIRTHAMVSVACAVFVISAFLIYAEVSAQQRESDPLRVVQGLAQAVGFIGAGAIFFARGKVHNLTSAANIWLATSVGIASGAGQLWLAAIATGFGVFLLTAVRGLENLLPGSKGKADED